jgi:hypothetical protein
VFVVGGRYLVRVYGKNTSLLVDRDNEVRLMVHIAAHGVGAPPLARFANGLAYPFIEGTPCKPHDVCRDAVWPLVARHLARWHGLPIPDGSPRTPGYVQTMRRWLSHGAYEYSALSQSTGSDAPDGHLSRLQCQMRRSGACPRTAG